MLQCQTVADVVSSPTAVLAVATACRQALTAGLAADAGADVRSLLKSAQRSPPAAGAAAGGAALAAGAVWPSDCSKASQASALAVCVHIGMNTVRMLDLSTDLLERWYSVPPHGVTRRKVLCIPVMIASQATLHQDGTCLCCTFRGGDSRPPIKSGASVDAGAGALAEGWAAAGRGAGFGGRAATLRPSDAATFGSTCYTCSDTVNTGFCPAGRLIHTECGTLPTSTRQGKHLDV